MGTAGRVVMWTPALTPSWMEYRAAASLSGASMMLTKVVRSEDAVEAEPLHVGHVRLGGCVHDEVGVAEDGFLSFAGERHEQDVVGQCHPRCRLGWGDSSRERDSLPLVHLPRKGWIPAFAGMTEGANPPSLPLRGISPSGGDGDEIPAFAGMTGGGGAE